MRKINFLLLTIVILSIGIFTSCESSDNEESSINQTVLIYMTDNNNLFSEAVANMNSLLSSYVPDDLQNGGGDILLVYTRALEKSEGSIAKDQKPQLLRIFKDSDSNIKYEVLKEYPASVNSATKEQLKSVLDYANNLYSGEENGLILWDHGTGWSPVTNSSMKAPQAYGFENNKSIDVQDLPSILGEKYSYIVFDCCFMGGVEVEYELKNNVDFIVASQTTIGGEGFPYTKVIADLLSGDRADLKLLAEDYYNYYSTEAPCKEASISLCKTSGFDDLSTAAAKIFDKDRENISNIDFSSVQSFSHSPDNLYYDLYDFMKSISTNSNELAILKTAIDNLVVYTNHTSLCNGININTDCGLSTFIPEENASLYFDYYKNYSWNQKTQLIK
ncbi:MAG: clostripain-related cysteine peptidase [Bacteroidales bacterium]